MSILATILGGAGAVFNALANLTDEQMQAVCPNAESTVSGSPAIDSFGPLEEVKEAVKQIDSLNDLSSYYMCSQTCPCLKPADSVISGWSSAQNWFNIEEKALRAQERTWDTGNTLFYNPIVFFSQEELNAGGLQSFSKFSDCANALIEKTWEPKSNDATLTSSIAGLIA